MLFFFLIAFYLFIYFESFIAKGCINMVYNIKFYIISLSHVKDNAAPLILCNWMCETSARITRHIDFDLVCDYNLKDRMESIET